MRILIVSNTYPPDISGVGSLVEELAKNLDAADGHEVHVLTRTTQAQDPWVVGVGGSKYLYPLRVGRAFRELCSDQRFDLIHVHESDAYSVVRQWHGARKRGEPLGRAKLVATLQVTYDQERRVLRPVRLRDRGAAIISRPTPAELWFREVKARWHSLFGRKIVSWADAVVAPSRVTAEELRADYGASEVEVIYNGLDISAGAIPRAVPGRHSEPGKARVLYMGRLRTRKAVAVLLHAFTDVLQRWPEAELEIVGDGEQMAALQRLRRELGLGAEVKLVGHRKRDEALPFYSTADIYCLPSLYEGFPVATLEAMAAGLPVVSTGVSGIPEQVIHGETGLIVPTEDAGALAEALSTLIGDPDLRRRMGEAGRRLVEEKFNIQKIAGDYLKLWENLLADRT